MSRAVRDNGGPAFPQGEFSAYEPSREGMTLRAWFAGQAMAALANSTVEADMTRQQMATAAKGFYALADAMIAEREK